MNLRQGLSNFIANISQPTLTWRRRIQKLAEQDPDGEGAVPVALLSRAVVTENGGIALAPQNGDTYPTTAQVSTMLGTLSGSTTTNTAETQQTLTDGATVNWNMNNGGYGVLTLGGNRAIANPTNTRNGATYVLEIVQDATGSRTVTWGANFMWSGGTAPTLTTTAGKRDIITFVCSGGKLYGTTVPNF